MLEKIFEIDLNTKFQDSQNTDIIANQGDTRSVVFNLRIYDGVNEINYADAAQAVLFIAKPDRHGVQLICAPAEKGYTVTLSQNALAAPGRAVCELSLYGHTGERITSLRFNFFIKNDLMGAELESSTEFDSLQDAIRLLKELQAAWEEVQGFERAMPIVTSTGTGDVFEVEIPDAPNPLPDGYRFWLVPHRGAGHGRAARLSVNGSTPGTIGNHNLDDVNFTFLHSRSVGGAVEMVFSTDVILPGAFGDSVSISYTRNLFLLDANL